MCTRTAGTIACSYDDSVYGVSIETARVVLSSPESVSARAMGKGNRSGVLELHAAGGETYEVSWMSAVEARRKAARVTDLFTETGDRQVIVDQRGPIWWLVFTLGLGSLAAWGIKKQLRSLQWSWIRVDPAAAAVHVSRYFALVPLGTRSYSLAGLREVVVKTSHIDLPFLRRGAPLEVAGQVVLVYHSGERALLTPDPLLGDEVHERAAERLRRAALGE